MESLDIEVIIVIAIFPILIIIIVAYSVFSERCPECKRYFALNRTGKERDQKGWFFGVTYDEWRCKHCKHRVWKRVKGEAGPGP